MGLLDILNGMQNGPGGARPGAPAPSSSGGGMSPMMMALLGLLAYKAIKGGGLENMLRGATGGQPQPAPTNSGAGGGGLGDILGDILGGGRTQQGGGASPNAPRPQPGSVSLEDLLREMMGGGQGGGGGNREIADRSRQRIDDVLGGGTRSGNAADDLLNSVDRMTRKR